MFVNVREAEMKVWDSKCPKMILDNETCVKDTDSSQVEHSM